MKKIYLLFLACLAITNATAQSTIDEVFTTLKFNNSMQFYVINSSIYGMDYTDGIVRKYDKVWNLQETHDAQQESYEGLMSKTATRSYEYNSDLKIFQLKPWKDEDPPYTQRRRYSFSSTNFNDFYQGKESQLYYIKQTNKIFISKHTVYRYGDNLTGIAGEISSTYNSYTTLITNFEFVNWDGSLVQTIILPYYVNNANPQFINIEDKSYIIIGANKLYMKDVPEDWELHSATEYDINSKEVEAGVYHYFVYEYVRETNEVKYIRSFTSSKEEKKEIARFDLNGTKKSELQKGANLILYSDGSSKKVMQK